MAIELTTGNVLWIIGMFVMALWALAKVIAHVYDRRFTERFTSAESRLLELETGLNSAGSRLSKVEVKLQSVPGHEDLAKIYERVNRVAEDIKGLSGEFAGVRRTLDLLNEYLLKEGRSK